MTTKIIGFIGAGNMGSAMIGGICRSNLISSNQIIASEPSSTSREKLESAYGIRTSISNEDTAKTSDVLFLAVKPYLFDEVLPPLASSLKKDCIVVSIAAGQSIASIETLLGTDIKLIRAMPNTPALVGESMSALCRNGNVTDTELNFVQQLFDCFGKTEIVKETMIDTIVGISGSSPAYVYMFIEAMADAAVADGMPRAMAYKFAAQSVLGSAKMVLDTGKHPGELKDMVCSPAGTTIEAVSVLEKNGFRHAVISAQRSCVQKSKDLTTRRA